MKWLIGLILALTFTCTASASGVVVDVPASVEVMVSPRDPVVLVRVPTVVQRLRNLPRLRLRRPMVTRRALVPRLYLVR